ncbi:unnamed protein product, partial [Ectocarpus sp. 12 AP-2014]
CRNWAKFPVWFEKQPAGRGVSTTLLASSATRGIGSLGLVSELGRLATREKELNSAASTAPNVPTDVAKEAEGELRLLGPMPAEADVFPDPQGAVNAAPLTEVINAAPVTGVTGMAGPPSDVQAGPAAIHGTEPHPAVAGAVIVSLVLFVVGAAILQGRRGVMRWGRRRVVRLGRRRRVAALELE